MGTMASDYVTFYAATRGQVGNAERLDSYSVEGAS